MLIILIILLVLLIGGGGYGWVSYPDYRMPFGIVGLLLFVLLIFLIVRAAGFVL